MNEYHTLSTNYTWEQRGTEALAFAAHKPTFP